MTETSKDKQKEKFVWKPGQIVIIKKPKKAKGYKIYWRIP